MDLTQANKNNSLRHLKVHFFNELTGQTFNKHQKNI